ncbi:hypothetical protein KY290_002768 [Solanum tuberosum]|uniref:Uncharacterized protein n=1 Tax=Solanum tuberosum TaxID=4113 RepID=A0ABQ7WRI0_SOLTU|nr:hypothetical protein KY285_002708 [Solanum tuberosum]KAH0783170.1 hypothetical protein KY290_002768 [Solanum tuberosum]
METIARSPTEFRKVCYKEENKSRMYTAGWVIQVENSSQRQIVVLGVWLSQRNCFRCFCPCLFHRCAPSGTTIARSYRKNTGAIELRRFAFKKTDLECTELLVRTGSPSKLGTVAKLLA